MSQSHDPWPVIRLYSVFCIPHLVSLFAAGHAVRLLACGWSRHGVPNFDVGLIWRARQTPCGMGQCGQHARVPRIISTISPALENLSLKVRQ